MLDLSRVFTALAVLPLAACVYYWVQRRTVKHSPKDIPGPSGWPIIGNLLDMPTKNEWLRYKEMCEEHSMSFFAAVGGHVLSNMNAESDIIQLDVFGTSIVILNSLEAITDLLEKRSSIYSTRCASLIISVTRRSNNNHTDFDCPWSTSCNRHY